MLIAQHASFSMGHWDRGRWLWGWGVEVSVVVSMESGSSHTACLHTYALFQVSCVPPGCDHCVRLCVRFVCLLIQGQVAPLDLSGIDLGRPSGQSLRVDYAWTVHLIWKLSLPILVAIVRARSLSSC